MGLKTAGFGSAVVALALLAPAERASADAIDGHWCFAGDSETWRRCSERIS